MTQEVLKLALNALEAMQMYAAAEHKGLLIICDEAIAAIKAALAQQQPIGYAVPTFDFDNSVIKKVHYAGTVPLYTTPLQQYQEPIGYAVPTFDFDNSVIKKVHCARTVPLYTTPTQPAQRTWAGLTDEVAQWLYDTCRTPSDLIDMVEAKLKKLNMTGYQRQKAMANKSAPPPWPFSPPTGALLWTKQEERNL